ncbi:MAG: DUF1016 N-terminal domain-containing protein [Candidatus Gastranaerophilales bacterium]|nr:DUF1016 N-terminal domain-containing protein [Candidatus Gastranaerophilales bacterium]
MIKSLSKELTKLYGRGFTKTNLYSFYSFYRCFPKIFHAVSGKSVRLLSWTHYRCLIQVKGEAARKWYEKEAYEQTWAFGLCSATLIRNITTDFWQVRIQYLLNRK